MVMRIFEYYIKNTSWCANIFKKCAEKKNGYTFYPIRQNGQKLQWKHFYQLYFQHAHQQKKQNKHKFQFLIFGTSLSESDDFVPRSIQSQNMSSLLMNMLKRNEQIVFNYISDVVDDMKDKMFTQHCFIVVFIK